ncbi:MAG: xylulokinase [Actinomycetales bacterium]
MTRLVLGIDSSTQSCTALLVDADSGEVVDRQNEPHPPGTQVHPQDWLDALDTATADLLLQAHAVAVAGHQHGMVTLADDASFVRPAMLWNDTSSAPEAIDLTARLGGAQAAADLIGSVPVAALTATKLAWLRAHEPDDAERTATVLLPHDLLTWHLGRRREFTTDHSDASGTGYYCPRERRLLPGLAADLLGHQPALPRVADPDEEVGRTRTGAVVAAGMGDNAAAAFGLGLAPGEMAVSLGTSGVACTVADAPAHDGTGEVSGFCDATGRYLPLACTLNGARVLDLACSLLGVDHAGLDELALAAPADADGLVLLPYLDGERTPNRPEATGLLHGLRSGTSRQSVARAFVHGLLCSVRDAMNAVERATGVTTTRVLLIGGGANSRAVRELAPTIFATPVDVPDPADYVALGAARQAAWVLSGKPDPPAWQAFSATTFTGEPNPDVVQAHHALREATDPGAWRPHPSR